MRGSRASRSVSMANASRDVTNPTLCSSKQIEKRGEPVKLLPQRAVSGDKDGKRLGRLDFPPRGLVEAHFTQAA